MIRRWARRNPGQCPSCYTLTDVKLESAKAIVTCCICGTRFTKRILLAPFLPKVGVVCPDHNSIRSAK